MTARASSWCSSSRPGAAPTRPPSRDASGCRRFSFRRAFSKTAGRGFVKRTRAELHELTGTADADQCRIPRTRRASRNHSGVSAAGRAVAAARPDAAQYFRAALSGDGRRRAARRPPADRHDPAGYLPLQGRGKAGAVPGRLRRPHHPARRIRRRPLHPRTHRRLALQGGGGNRRP